jgi:hypothetical protein
MGVATAGGHESECREARWPYLALAACAAVFFYLLLFHFSLLPIWREGDESSYLDHAEHMLHGQGLYGDLFQFNLPGTDYLYYFLFRIFGLKIWVGHFALLIAFTAVTVLIYSLSRVVLRGTAALVPPVAFLAICQRSAIDGTHHWYSTALVLFAITFISKVRGSWQIGLAGAVLGVATLFTSTRGIFVATGVALFFVWELGNWRDASKAIATLFVSFAAIVSAALIYLSLLVGPRVLFNSIVVFPLRYYPAGAANSFSIYYSGLQTMLPSRVTFILSVFQWLATNVALPLLLIAFAVKFFRSGSAALRATRSNRALVLYAFVSFFALLPAAGAPSAPRLNCALSFAYILGTVMLYGAGGRKLTAAALAVVVVAGLAEMSAAILRPVSLVNGPRGAFASYISDRADYFTWFVRNAHPGDLLFGDVDVNFLVGLENPASVQWLERDAYTRPEQVSALVSTLERRKTRFFVDDEEYGRGTEDNLQPIRDYLKQHYHFAQGHSDDPGIIGDAPSCQVCAPVMIRNGM